MKRVLRKVAKGVGYSIAAVMALLVIAVLGVVGVTQTQWGLTRGAAFLSSTLSNLLNGDYAISFERARLGFGGLEGVSAQMRAQPGGPLLLDVHGLTIGWSAWKFIRSLPATTLDIELPEVSVDRAYVDASDVDVLAWAFSLRDPSVSTQPVQEPTVAFRITHATIKELSGLAPGLQSPLQVSTATAHGSVLVDNDVVIDASVPNLLAKARTAEDGVELDVSGAGNVVVSLDAQSVLVLGAQYTGHVGAVFADVNAALVNDDWSAISNIQAEPDAVAAFELGWQLGSTLDAVVMALGDMAAASALVALRGERSDVRVAASATFEPLSLRAVVEGDRIDPHEVHVAADHGQVDLLANVHYTSKDLELDMRSKAGSYARMAIPPARFVLRAQELKAYQLDVTLEDESKAHLRADVTLGERVEAFASFDSRALPRAASKQLDERVVVDDVHATLSAVANQEFELRSVRATAQARRVGVKAIGLLVDDLSTTVVMRDITRVEQITATLQASKVGIGQVLLSKVDLEVEPSSTGNRLQGTANLKLDADAPVQPLRMSVNVHTIQPIELAALRLSLGAPRAPLELDVASVRQLETGWQLEAVRLNGAGKLTLDALVGSKTKVALGAEQLDLEQLSSVLRPLVPPLKGVFTGRSELLYRAPTDVRGFADFQGTGIRLGTFDDVKTDVHVRSDGTLLNGHVNVARGATRVQAALDDIGVDALGNVAAHPDTTTLADVAGAIAVSVSTTGEELAASLDEPQLNQDLTLQAVIALINQRNAPLHFDTKARALLRGARPESPSGSGMPKEVQFVWTSDFKHGDASWRHQFELTATDISTLQGEATVTLPLADVPLIELPTSLLTAPLRAHLQVAKIDLALLPRDLPLPGLEGTLEAQAAMEGTLGSPRGRVDLTVKELQVQSVEQSLAVSVRANAEYLDNALHAEFALTHEHSKVASGKIDGNWATNRWLLAARLDDISLGCFPYVRDYGIEGHLTGFAELEAGEELTAKAYLLGRGFRFNAADVPYWSLQGDVGGGEGNAVLTLIEPSGFARVAVQAREMGPTLADVGPLKVTAAMKNFQLRPVLGLAGGVVRDGAGIVNGNLEAEFSEQNIAASGSLVLRDGRLLVPVLGRDFTDLRATLRAEPGKLAIEEFKGRFGSGRFKGDGRLAYDQSANLKAELELRIPSSAPIPITREGRDVAEMSGRVDVRAQNTKAGFTSEVNLSKIDVFVSEETDQVLALDAPDYATIGYRTAGGKFMAYGSEEVKPEPKPERGEPTTLKVKLGRDVWVHRGQGTFAALEGGLTLKIGNDMRSEGSLVIPEGRIDVMGRVFEVQPSTVTFGGEDMDPDVVAEARWLSPSGHTVIASFRGPVSSGKMELRSEPALSYGEILNVLLFDDPTGAPESGAPPTATSVAGTLVGAGLGRTLSDLTNLDLQANVETTESGSTRPEIGIRISPRLALQVSYNPQPVVSLTEPPDQAQVSLDWRISKGWSLESKLGNQGSASADLSWQFRY